MRKLSLLGSTGSIGKSTLGVARHLKEELCVTALAARSNIDLLEQQIQEFNPSLVAVFDEKKALELFEQSHRYSDGLYKVGMMYLNGEGVTQLINKGIILISNAAYMSNKKALTTLKHVARTGNGNAEMRLYLIYNYGYGGETIDYKEACEWVEKAASHGNSQAQFVLGAMYNRGIEIPGYSLPKNLEKAGELFLKSAQHGNPSGERALGEYFYDGLITSGGSHDNKSAIYWLEKSASQGDIQAKEDLSQITEERSSLHMLSEFLFDDTEFLWEKLPD